jgi:S1-C subfamily serine protease
VAGCAAALLVGLVGGGLAINVFGGDDNDAAAGAGLPSQTTTVLTRPDQPNFRDGERQDGTTEDDPASTEDGAFAEDGTAPSTAPARTPGGGAPPALDESLEPVAAAAAAVKPAVVQLETNRGLGSGFIYDREGLILTAAHVVENARQVTVRLGDGTTKPGEVLGVDVNTDVAVVKIDPFPGMPLASLALEETPVVGQTAIAIGSPYGLDQTVTAGIVSAINRPVPVGNNVVPMVQTDAAINTGNSGGALIDLEGRVIGINDQIRTSSGDNSGIGFAIPIGLAYDVAGRIVRGESLEFGYLGISRGNDTAFGSAGALVTRVEPGSPAERAGLRVGDVVIEIDGDAIRSFDELVAQIRARTPGDKVELTVRRNGEVSTVTATLSSN